MNDSLTITWIKDKEYYELLFWDGMEEKNLGFARDLNTILWFYMQGKNLDIFVDDGDSLNLIRGWD
jgi:hypothetical protein